MSNKSDSLGDRMKRYEYVTRNYLTRRIPAIIRIDGKAFHTFTRGMKKPFDDIMMVTMQYTMKRLCENIQGCVFGYTQSDEITLVLTDYTTIKTDAWFGYNVQKMTSIAASMATLYFNDKFYHEVYERVMSLPALVDDGTYEKSEYNYLWILEGKYNKALFDARVFSIPKDEVCNCLIWRQQDATRNSIEAVGQANFSYKELHRKSCNQIQDMLMTEKGINWNDYPIDCKRGVCCYKIGTERVMSNPQNPDELIPVTRKIWKIDREPPIFTQDRDYIERWL